jgi:hypothetical protein
MPSRHGLTTFPITTGRWPAAAAATHPPPDGGSARPAMSPITSCAPLPAVPARHGSSHNPELAAQPAVSFDPAAYAASAESLLDLVRRQPPVTRTLVVVGHDLALPELALALAAASAPSGGQPAAQAPATAFERIGRSSRPPRSQFWSSPYRGPSWHPVAHVLPARHPARHGHGEPQCPRPQPLRPPPHARTGSASQRASSSPGLCQGRAYCEPRRRCRRAAPPSAPSGQPPAPAGGVGTVGRAAVRIPARLARNL